MSEKTFKVPDFSCYTIRTIKYEAEDFPKGIDTVHIGRSQNTFYDINFPKTVKTLILKEQEFNPFETLNLKDTKIKVLEFSYIYKFFHFCRLDGEMLPEGLEELEIWNVNTVKNLHVLKHLVRLKINTETKIEDGGLPEGLLSLSAPYNVIKEIQKKNLLPMNLKEMEIKINKDLPKEEFSEEYKIPASVETFKATAYQKGRNAWGGNNLKIDYKNSNVKHLELDHSSLNGEGLDGEMLPESLETLKFLQYLPKKPIKNLNVLPNLKALKIWCSMVDYLLVDGGITLPENLEYLECYFKVFVELCMANKCPQNLKCVTLVDLGHFLNNNEYEGFKFPKNIQTVNAPMLSLEDKIIFEERFGGIEINPEDLVIPYFN